jgi:hypothetical protein
MGGSKKVPAAGSGGAHALAQTAQTSLGEAAPPEPRAEISMPDAVTHSPPPPVHTARERARRATIVGSSAGRGVKRSAAEASLESRPNAKKPKESFLARLPDLALTTVLSYASRHAAVNALIAEPSLQSRFPTDPKEEHENSFDAAKHLDAALKDLAGHSDLLGSVSRVFGITSPELRQQLERIVVKNLSRNGGAVTQSEHNFQRLLHLLGRIDTPEYRLKLANVFINQLFNTHQGREVVQAAAKKRAPVGELKVAAQGFGLIEPAHIEIFETVALALLKDAGSEPIESFLIRQHVSGFMVDGESAEKLAKDFGIISPESRKQLENYALQADSKVQRSIKQGDSADEIIATYGLVDPEVIAKIRAEVARQDPVARIANLDV